ncbi:MAG: hypothetical protein QNJ38_19140 [Prochloraceae cyanobacterium]|nr:hypothetical protein [Prochloraceae cyanobacterium]
MIKQTFKILTFLTISIIFCNLKIFPANATSISETTTPNSEKPLGDTRLFENTPLFESNNFQIAFLTTLLVTASGIVLGKGKSLKHEEADSNRKAIEATPIATTTLNQPQLKLNQETIQSNLVRLDRVKDRISVLEERDLSQESEQLKLSESWLENNSINENRQTYLNLKRLVLESIDFNKDCLWEPDNWDIDVEIAILLLFKSSDNFQEVEQVLLQSNELREWYKILPEHEYRVKAAQYIEKAYDWAINLRKWREQKNDFS